MPDTQKYCPMCDRGYATLALLQAHLAKAKAEGDGDHIDVIQLEGWDEKPLSES